jgi:hypothetical protein
MFSVESSNIAAQAAIRIARIRLAAGVGAWSRKAAILSEIFGNNGKNPFLANYWPFFSFYHFLCGLVRKAAPNSAGRNGL